MDHGDLRDDDAWFPHTGLAPSRPDDPHLFNADRAAGDPGNLASGEGRRLLSPISTEHWKLMIEKSYHSQDLHGPHELRDIGNLDLEEGGTIRGRKLAFATSGSLNASSDKGLLWMSYRKNRAEKCLFLSRWCPLMAEFSCIPRDSADRPRLNSHTTICVTGRTTAGFGQAVPVNRFSPLKHSEEIGRWTF